MKKGLLSAGAFIFPTYYDLYVSPGTLGFFFFFCFFWKEQIDSDSQVTVKPCVSFLPTQFTYTTAR